MTHTRKEQFYFFSLIDRYIDEKLFLPLILRKLSEGLSQKERNIMKKKLNEIDLGFDVNKIKIMALFYCLHIQKPKHGNIFMLTKKLIRETKITFKADYLNKLNKDLKNLVKEIGLPPLEGTSKQFIQNLYFYEPDFLEKYPDLDVNLEI